MPTRKQPEGGEEIEWVPLIQGARIIAGLNSQAPNPLAAFPQAGPLLLEALRTGEGNIASQGRHDGHEGKEPLTVRHWQDKIVDSERLALKPRYEPSVRRRGVYPGWIFNIEVDARAIRRAFGRTAADGRSPDTPRSTRKPRKKRRKSAEQLAVEAAIEALTEAELSKLHSKTAEQRIMDWIQTDRGLTVSDVTIRKFRSQLAEHN